MKIAAISATLAGLIVAAPLFAQEVVSTGRRIEAHLDLRSQRAVEGINSFSLDFYKRSISREQNLFISPASVSTAVGLAYRGARGPSAEELRVTMHYDASPEAHLAADAAILKSLNFTGVERELRVANALWLEQGMPLRPDFSDDVTKHAQAGISRVDFRSNPDAARLTINRWVAAATNDRIKNLLQEEDITDQTRAALVNSIYWKGRRAAPFQAAGTKIEPFLGLNVEHKPTSLMHQQGNFQVYERGGIRAIQLPYAFNEVSMVVLLPDGSSGLPRLEKKLTDGELKRWLSDLDATAPRDTIVTLPKMHLEWRDDLVPTLQCLGATTAFGDDADFSGMAVEPFPGEVPRAIGLKIKKVIHQTFFDVDEQGSEAAAATAVLTDVTVTGARRGPPPPPPFVFRADKPFLFLLRDRRTNLILFMGRYVTPTQRYWIFTETRWSPAAYMLLADRKSMCYRSQRDDDAELRSDLRERAQQRRRFGYRRLHILLRRERVVINRKMMQRLYSEEKLAVRRGRSRRRAIGARGPAPVLVLSSQRWSLDFVHDQMASGRQFRVLNIVDNIVDDVTRACLRAVPDTSLSERRVVHELTEMIAERGMPGMIVSDNGTEPTSNAVLA